MTNDVARVPSRSLLAELTACGVVSPAELVSCVVEFEEVSMSHAAYRLSVDGDVRAFVKRSDPVRSQGRDLGSEATLYRLAAQEPALAGIVPRCHAVSPDDSFVVLDALPVPPDGSRWPLSGPVLEGPAGHPALRAYGQAIAATHSVHPAPFGEVPWLLHGVDSGLGDDASLPPGVRRLFRRVAGEPIFRRGFRAALHTWEPVSLIHGDLRWSNVLPSLGGPPHVWLVDWELACLGDPAWDVGSVLADILAAATVDSKTMTTIEQLCETAAPFLAAYRGGTQPDLGAWRSLLLRSARCAGVRLVQTISEYGHIDPTEMDAIEPLLLPWSAELFAQPGPVSAELARAVPG